MAREKSQTAEKPEKARYEQEEVRLEEALEHLRVMLSVEMKDLRSRRGLSQEQLAERIDFEQPWISKIENPDSQTGIENILRYLFAMGAELILGIRDDERFIPVSEDAERWWEEHQNSLDSPANKTIKSSPDKKKKLVQLTEIVSSSSKSSNPSDKSKPSPMAG